MSIVPQTLEPTDIDRPVIAYGGGRMRGPNSQTDSLQKGADVLVCTLGRLGDFLNQPEVLSLRRMK